MPTINRDDLLEITRRMTVARTAMTRVAGAYMDRDGFVDGTFNTNFLKLTPAQKNQNLALARAVPFADTNVNLKRFRFPKTAYGSNTMRQLLLGLKSCGLKNDALLDTFYDYVGEHYGSNHDYGVFVFHSTYDIPVKGTDKARLWDSEEVYEFLICVICPVTGDYEPGEPECGFMFPAFCDRTEDPDYVDVFQRNAKMPREEIYRILGLV